MRILGKLVLGFLGLCVLLPGLCLGAFGLGVLPSLLAGDAASLMWVVGLFSAAGLMVWAAIYLFSRVGDE